MYNVNFIIKVKIPHEREFEYYYYSLLEFYLFKQVSTLPSNDYWNNTVTFCNFDNVEIFEISTEYLVEYGQSVKNIYLKSIIYTDIDNLLKDIENLKERGFQYFIQKSKKEKILLNSSLSEDKIRKIVSEELSKIPDDVLKEINRYRLSCKEKELCINI